METENEFSCPYLGLKEDTETSLTFPSTRHCCKNALPPNFPSLEHQSSFCLSSNYSSCQVFSSSTAAHLPENIRFEQSQGANNKLNWTILGLVVIGIITILGWWQLGDAFAPQAAVNTPILVQTQENMAEPATPLAIAPSVTPALVLELAGQKVYLPNLFAADVNELSAVEPLVSPETVSNAAYPEPQATAAPVKCQPPSGWVSYAIQSGDTLFQLALSTRTTVGEIQQANCMNSTLIRVGQRLYLPSLPPKSSSPTKTPRPQPTKEPPLPTEAPPTVYPGPEPYP